jgi:protein-disulfide isomerase
MQPQSLEQPEPRRARRADPERRMSNRAKRQLAEEQAARRRQLAWLGAAVGLALVAALALILLNRPRAADAPITLAAPLPASVAFSGTTMGEKTAKVAIVEWGDYQCPWCGTFTREMAPKLIEQYVKPGLVTYEFRNFAFLGAESVRAAEAAACAADQNAFWPYHNTLYQNQQGENQNAFSNARLQQIAAALSLDTGAFNRCLDSGEKKAAVEQSAAEARKQGIDSTPTIFVDGAEVPWQWETLKPAIDAALAKE